MYVRKKEPSTTERLRRMKVNDTITLPANLLAGLQASILTRLRKEHIAVGANWKVEKQDPITGTFEVRRVK